MPRSLIGAHIRERRRALGVTQARLAATLGISASYLNLIELNKRNIGGALLKRVADALGVAIDELDGAAGRRLLHDLGALTADARLAPLQLDAASVDDLAGRHPDWARALVVLQRALLDRDRAVAALSDRLSQDPLLVEVLHSVRSRIAAIRSSSEILDSFDDLEPAQRQRFVSILSLESARLSELTPRLDEFFEPTHTVTRSITPVDEVDDFLFDHADHFPTLEQTSDELRAAAGIEAECREDVLASYLLSAHELRTELRSAAGALAVAAAPASEEDPTLYIDSPAPAPTRRFQLARAAAERFRQADAVGAEIAAAPRLTSEAARRLARHALTSYLAAAVLMPYEVFLDAAERSRYDLDILARRFGASHEQVCHRLVTLRRPGAEGIPFGLMRSDPAGFVTKRFPLPNLLLPRHGNACPLWPVYGAFQSPGAIVRQLAAFPTGDRFLFVARAIEKPRPGFTMPRRLLSVMLACDAIHADRTVYGDELDLSSSAPAVPVGPNCRLCVRRNCVYREEEPLIGI